jgi:hypothetical protein
MKNRREFLLTLIVGLVAAVVIITPVIADELIGYITKVDVDGKKLTVEAKEDGKIHEIKTTDATERVTGKGDSVPLDLEKLSKQVAKAVEKNGKGLSVTITHEKHVASRIKSAGKKKADN